MRVTPIAAWLHQFTKAEMLAAFAAPIFSREMRGKEPWGTNFFCGVVGMHWYNDRFQLLYGGVFENSFGQQRGYPYLGMLWMLSKHCSLSLVFPWPAISYVPRDRWLLQLGLAPGGSTWVRRGDGFETVQSFGSWNVNGGVAYRLRGPLWLYGSVGVAGLRGAGIGGAETKRFASNPSPVFSLALQIRP
jgi:opacity protein-like surface antigen